MKHEIEVFAAEREAGLEEQVKANASVAYLTQLTPLDPDTALAQRLTRALASEKSVNDNTLFHMQDILVTTGDNKNTDYFDRVETWNARATPEDKPLNFEHDEFKIIGHITETQVVDENYEVIPDDTAVEDLPAKFHILNGSVIYAFWSDDDQQTLIDTTIEEIKAGEWFVSMEAAFRGFDYVVADPEGNKRVVARDENSAWLTKHLRQYGGDGVFVDKATGSEYKIFRLLKNIVFSGKGLVRRPANPESVILTEVQKSDAKVVPPVEDLGYVTVGTINGLTSIAMESNKMPDVNPEVKLLQDRVAALETENKGLATKLAEKDGEATQAKISTLESDLTAKATENGQLQTQVDALKESVADLTKRLEAAESAKSSVESELAKVKAEQVKASRLATLIEKGADKVKAESLVAKFSNLTDEQFVEMVEVLSAAFTSDDDDDDDDDEEEDDKKEKKKKKSKADTEDGDGEDESEKKAKKKAKKTDATSVIDNATVVDEPALASDETPKTETTRAATAKFITGFLRYNKNVNTD